jgi:hypothetical protein
MMLTDPMLFEFPILANLPPDPLDKILPWITTFVGVVLAAVFKVQADKAKALRIEDPVPTVPVRKVPGVPSWNDHSNLVERVGRLESHIDKMRDEQAEQFRDLLIAGATRQEAIVKQLSDKIDTVARDWHGRLDAISRPPNRP